VRVFSTECLYNIWNNLFHLDVQFDVDVYADFTPAMHLRGFYSQDSTLRR
jgi:hypothetical protein